MTWAALVVVVVAVATGCLAMAVVVACTKATRTSRARRRAARLRPYRRDLVTVAAGEDDGGHSLLTLAGAGGASAEVVDETVADLLGKIRGAPAEQLVEVLVRHGALRRALRDLGHAAPLRRAKAAQLLGLAREASATAALVDALRDPHVEVRTSAAYALGLIGDPAAAGPLLHAVGEPGARVPAGTAADALLGLGIGISGALLAGLAADDARARHVAAYVSGVGAFTRSAPLLRGLLAEDPDLTVREASAEALASVGGADDVQVLSRHTAPDMPLPLRRVCASALGDLGHPGAQPALEALLDDPDPRLAELAAGALLQLSPAAAPRLLARAGAEEQDAGRGRPVAAALTLARLQGVLR
jgi:hypothetical protein